MTVIPQGQVAVILGAGASIPAGFASTCLITNQVLSGNGTRRLSDGTYSHQTENSSLPPDQPSLLAANLARYFHEKAEQYYSGKSGELPNYEDLFYLADQLYSEVMGEAENPALKAFECQFRSNVTPLLERSDLAWSYRDLLTETKNYITDTVRQCLSQTAQSHYHLKVIHEVCARGLVSTIATLCHDTHVERYLVDKGILLSDGFSEEQAGVRYWVGDFSNTESVSFLKLHGSVNWFRLRPDGSKHWHDDRIGIPLNGDPDHTRRPDGTLQMSQYSGRDMVLIGTFNKLSDYGRGIFGDLHYRFRSSIRSCCRLVVCGYSFGDKGINSEITEWMYAKRGRRLVVIHPHPEELANQARGAIRNKWDTWEEQGSVTTIPKRIECVEIDELLSCI